MTQMNMITNIAYTPVSRISLYVFWYPLRMASSEKTTPTWLVGKFQLMTPHEGAIPYQALRMASSENTTPTCTHQVSGLIQGNDPSRMGYSGNQVSQWRQEDMATCWHALRLNGMQATMVHYQLSLSPVHMWPYEHCIVIRE